MKQAMRAMPFKRGFLTIDPVAVSNANSDTSGMASPKSHCKSARQKRKRYAGVKTAKPVQSQGRVWYLVKPHRKIGAISISFAVDVVRIVQYNGAVYSMDSSSIRMDRNGKPCPPRFRDGVARRFVGLGK